jgi:hypothetical protein
VTKETGADAITAVARLRAALERTADALVRPQLDSLLTSESEIELALAGLPPINTLSADERQAVRVEVEAASRALLRCRRLGAALDDFVRITLEAQGRGTDYGPRRAAAGPYSRQAFNARV